MYKKIIPETVFLFVFFTFEIYLIRKLVLSIKTSLEIYQLPPSLFNLYVALIFGLLVFIVLDLVLIKRKINKNNI